MYTLSGLNYSALVWIKFSSGYKKEDKNLK